MSNKITKTFNDKLAFISFCADIANRWDWSRPLVLKLDEMRRKEEQSRKFHAMCGDLEKQGIEWAGSPRTAPQWKHLLISGHSVATKNDVEIVEGLEGELLNIRESSSEMTIRRMASLIEYTQAWAAGKGVVFKAPDYYDQYPEARR